MNEATALPPFDAANHCGWIVTRSDHERGVKMSSLSVPGFTCGRPPGVGLGAVSAAATNSIPVVGSTDIVRALTAVGIGASAT